LMPLLGPSWPTSQVPGYLASFDTPQRDDHSSSNVSHSAASCATASARERAGQPQRNMQSANSAGKMRQRTEHSLRRTRWTSSHCRLDLRTDCVCKAEADAPSGRPGRQTPAPRDLNLFRVTSAAETRVSSSVVCSGDEAGAYLMLAAHAVR